MTPIKSGVTTSEFWLHLFVQLIALAAAVLALLFHKTLAIPASAAAWVPVAGVIAATVSSAFYGHGRTSLKLRHLGQEAIAALPSIAKALPATATGAQVASVVTQAETIAGTVGQAVAPTPPV